MLYMYKTCLNIYISTFFIRLYEGMFVIFCLLFFYSIHFHGSFKQGESTFNYYPVLFCMMRKDFLFYSTYFHSTHTHTIPFPSITKSLLNIALWSSKGLSVMEVHFFDVQIDDSLDTCVW